MRWLQGSLPAFCDCRYAARFVSDSECMPVRPVVVVARAMSLARTVHVEADVEIQSDRYQVVIMQGGGLVRQ